MTTRRNGYARPFTNTIFGDFDFVEALATNGTSPLDVDLDVHWKFDGKQLEAYAALAFGRDHEAHSEQSAKAFVGNLCVDDQGRRTIVEGQNYKKPHRKREQANNGNSLV